MTNEEKFKSPKERIAAFDRFCTKKCAACAVIPQDSVCHCIARWLALEAEEEKPEPCPFCYRETMSRHLAGGFCVECDCGYTSPFAESEAAAIAAHNRVCKAVKAYKESGVAE